MTLAHNTDLWRGEGTHLNVGDVDLTSQVPIVREGEGKKDRPVPLTKDLCRELEPFVIGRGKSESVFGLAASTISGKIETWPDKAGVRLPTHSLWDNSGTTLDERGVSIRVTQGLLGH